MSFNKEVMHVDSETISIPVFYLTRLLTDIDNIVALKIAVYFFWYIDQQENKSKFITFDDILEDKKLISGINARDDLEEIVAEALESLQRSGILLSYKPTPDNIKNSHYFLNTQENKAIIRALENGQLSIQELVRLPIKLELDSLNIFKLYEENIGPLTPMIAESLQDAEKSYSHEWVVQAFRIAVEKNVRNWRYIEAILKSWQEKGRDGSNRQDTKEDRRRYFEGEYADFIEH